MVFWVQTLPGMEGSALRWCTEAVVGVSTPMLYIGMLFATFSWHVEDHFLYSVNYQHAGASKVWYGVPAAAANAFELAAAQTVYRKPCEAMLRSGCTQVQCMQRVAKTLMAKTTMISPKLLQARGVPVYRAVQEVGSYVITFPRAYHGGFSCGFNVGEAVNFATLDWWPFGHYARSLYRALKANQILAHERALCCEISHFLQSAKSMADETAVAVGGDVKEGLYKILNEGLRKMNATVAVFVSMMRRLNRYRALLEHRKALAVSADDSSAGGLKSEALCASCYDACYLGSVIDNVDRPVEQWQRLCLECAVRNPACGAASVILVHPEFSKMNRMARGLNTRVKSLGKLNSSRHLMPLKLCQLCSPKVQSIPS